MVSAAGDPSKPALGSRESYRGGHGAVAFSGRVVDDAALFAGYLRKRVRPRWSDDDGGFAEAMLALETTGVSATTIRRFLETDRRPEPWELGEAFAECAIPDDFGAEVVWPWNMARDKRTPEASLPGADLVGFLKRGSAVFLLFGEVKTSSDEASPPNVVYGRGGLTAQLERCATNHDIQRQLIAWLRPRCGDATLRSHFDAAVTRFLSEATRGALALIGVLLRDTVSAESDLAGRSKALAEHVNDRCDAALVAWYLPAAIADWPRIAFEAAS